MRILCHFGEFGGKLANVARDLLLTLFCNFHYTSSLKTQQDDGVCD